MVDTSAPLLPLHRRFDPKSDGVSGVGHHGLSSPGLQHGILNSWRILALFARFKTIPGLDLPEAALLYGMVHISFAIAEAVVREFDTFRPNMIKAGDFDRLLLRREARCSNCSARN